VACGERHSVALSSADGALFTFGVGRAGQLGHGDLRDQHRPKRVNALEGEGPSQSPHRLRV
jgi:alpha-tubulin suppressor-like RCC1 family protein